VGGGDEKNPNSKTLMVSFVDHYHVRQASLAYQGTCQLRKPLGFEDYIETARAMVDSVMIDAAYNGKVLNVTLADVPEKKNDLVAGKYLVQAKKGVSKTYQ
jgi:hypothetical protein